MHIKQEMIDFVINLLKNRIPGTYYYHNYEHTLYVMDKVVKIGKYENCSNNELKLLKTAALWHDLGYINTYKDHEEESCRLAKQSLPGYGYDTNEIDMICSMIMATKLPHTPADKLEEIIADADMEYLGTNEAATQANNLYRELKTLNSHLTKDEWDQIEIKFLQEHRFFTSYCKQYSVPAKVRYLNNLIYGS
ncbi:MAG: HD domain-containing protein [Ferruginibacter sp.]